MSICENLARVLCAVKEERGLSCDVFAKKLGIPKSSLWEYLKGTGNPRADTLEMLAHELGISVTEIVSGPLPGQEQAETMIRAAELFSNLTPEQRERGFQLFLALTVLFSEGT